MSEADSSSNAVPVPASSPSIPAAAAALVAPIVDEESKFLNFFVYKRNSSGKFQLRILQFDFQRQLFLNLENHNSGDVQKEFSFTQLKAIDKDTIHYSPLYVALAYHDRDLYHLYFQLKSEAEVFRLVCQDIIRNVKAKKLPVENPTGIRYIKKGVALINRDGGQYDRRLLTLHKYFLTVYAHPEEALKTPEGRNRPISMIPLFDIPFMNLNVMDRARNYPAVQFHSEDPDTTYTILCETDADCREWTNALFTASQNPKQLEDHEDWVAMKKRFEDMEKNTAAQKQQIEAMEKEMENLKKEMSKLKDEDDEESLGLRRAEEDRDQLTLDIESLKAENIALEEKYVSEVGDLEKTLEEDYAKRTAAVEAQRQKSVASRISEEQQMVEVEKQSTGIRSDVQKEADRILELDAKVSGCILKLSDVVAEDKDAQDALQREKHAFDTLRTENAGAFKEINDIKDKSKEVQKEVTAVEAKIAEINKRIEEKKRETEIASEATSGKREVLVPSVKARVEESKKKVTTETNLLEGAKEHLTRVKAELTMKQDELKLLQKKKSCCVIS